MSMEELKRDLEHARNVIETSEGIIKSQSALIEDLKGMIALLVASLRQCRYKAADPAGQLRAEEAVELISQAEAMMNKESE